MAIVLVSEATRQYAHNLDDLRQRWNIRREQATQFEWMPVIQFSGAVEILDSLALLAIRQELVEIQHAIKGRLGNARGKAKKYKVYSDEDWYQEMIAAEKSVGRHLLVVHDELSKRKRKMIAEREAIFGQRFVDAAKSILPKDVFLSIVSAANSTRPTLHAGDLRSAPSVQSGATREGETNSGESPSTRANA